MHQLAHHLVEDLNVHIDNIRLVTYPEEFPEKWDIADPVLSSSIDGHTFKALPYTEVTPNFKELWNKFKADLSEQDKVRRND